MLINNKPQLQNLIIIPLSCCFTHANAQDSVSSYEESLLQSSKTSLKSVSDEPEQSKYKLNQLSDELQKRGWKVDKEDDGSLILKPVNIDKSLSKKQPKPAIEKEKSNNYSFFTMQKKLQEKGWGVNKNSDGSIFLYPPKQSAVQTIKPKSTELLVNTWEQAHTVSQDWIKTNAVSNASVGKIRKIINVYIVSIVANKKPYTLLYQIAIRNHDAKVIPLN